MNLRKTIFYLLPERLQQEVKDYFRRRTNLKNFEPAHFDPPKFQSSIAALDYYQCIFVHIPKNAGLSVSYTLFGNTGGSHRKIKDYQDIFSPSTFKKYYKFTFVRNPWDRLVSTYFFLKNGGLTQKDQIWATNNVLPYINFTEFVQEWLNEKNITNSLHFQHQHVFLEDKKGRIAVNFIGRFETIDEDFEIITKKLNIDKVLTKTNTSKRKKNYREYYNEETKQIVAKVYQKDIRLFNYKF
ncbi:MAG: hypothetical protein CMC13_08415 [Flavobacteriaceae bacterium]|nr:hypothetical protein [Flavobacteriaceae bacterium]|tara:strand:+ start:1989 stop:2711 length:723 start_codon:yes stop_codon:yes gene_type:complete